MEPHPFSSLLPSLSLPVLFHDVALYASLGIVHNIFVSQENLLNKFIYYELN